MLDRYTEYKTAADFCLMRRLVRPGALWSLVLGALFFILGFARLQTSSASIVPMVLGLLMLAEGIWVLKSPSPAVVLGEGVVFAMLALWNIYIVFVSGHATASDHGSWPAIIVVQLVSAGWFFKHYQRFSYLAGKEPAKNVVDEMQKLITGVMKGKLKTDEGLVEFTSFLGKWRARLLDGEILLVNQKGQEIIFSRKDEVKLTGNGKVTMGKDTKVHLQVGQKQWKGQMSPQSFQRFDSWLMQVPEPPRPF